MTLCLNLSSKTLNVSLKSHKLMQDDFLNNPEYDYWYEDDCWEKDEFW